MSRSAAVVIAYFMNKYNLDYEEAYERYFQNIQLNVIII